MNCLSKILIDMLINVDPEINLNVVGVGYFHFCDAIMKYVQCQWLKGARYLLIIHEVLVAMDFFPAGVQDETLEEESQRLAS